MTVPDFRSDAENEIETQRESREIRVYSIDASPYLHRLYQEVLRSGTRRNSLRYASTMRSFLSTLQLGGLLRPAQAATGSSIVKSTTTISRLPRYASASTSAQPGSQSPDAFAVEDGPASASADASASDSPEELRRKAIKLYKEVCITIVTSARACS